MKSKSKSSTQVRKKASTCCFTRVALVTINIFFSEGDRLGGMGKKKRCTSSVKMGSG